MADRAVGTSVVGDHDHQVGVGQGLNEGILGQHRICHCEEQGAPFRTPAPPQALPQHSCLIPPAAFCGEEGPWPEGGAGTKKRVGSGVCVWGVSLKAQRNLLSSVRVP